MRLAIHYGFAGAAWGLVLGALAGLAAVAFAAGFSWLYLFGDDPWPESAGRGIALFGLAVGLAVLGAGAVLGGAYGRAAARAPLARHPALRRRAWLLTTLACIAGAALFALVYAGERRDAVQRQSAREAETRFEDLLAARHRIERIEVIEASEANELAVGANLVLSGGRRGSYRLTLTLEEQAYRKVLLEQSDVIELTPGATDRRYLFQIDLLRQFYQEKVLKGAGGVLVEEAFKLRVSLAPLLSDAEQTALPAHELQNLELGQSALISNATAEIPVRFTIPASPQ
ncbi:MAG: hypothetical protein OEM59_13485 [Rhodospirillales bacterium]|nr:hypothetical protein [Rhodospirillales bacterium]